jgi:hypothetical protein
LCSLDVGLPPAPVVRITDPPAALAAATSDVRVGVELSQPYPLPIAGQVRLSISAEARSLHANANQPDPRVRFAGGQTVASFTIPAGETKTTIPILSTGTVASTISISVTNLRAANVVLSSVVAPHVVRIPPSPPSIASVCYTVGAGVVSVKALGHSVTRELEVAEIVIGTESANMDISGISAAYFEADETIRSGGAFTLEMPHTRSESGPVSSVKVRISNSVGWSGFAEAQPCR